MRLIDADRLNADIVKAEETCDEAGTILGAGAIKELIKNAPTVWPIFSGRTTGKTAMKEYMAIVEMLKVSGMDTTNPVKTIDHLLTICDAMLDKESTEDCKESKDET